MSLPYYHKSGISEQQFFDERKEKEQEVYLEPHLISGVICWIIFHGLTFLMVYTYIRGIGTDSDSNPSVLFQGMVIGLLALCFCVLSLLFFARGKLIFKTTTWIGLILFFLVSAFMRTIVYLSEIYEFPEILVFSIFPSNFLYGLLSILIAHEEKINQTANGFIFIFSGFLHFLAIMVYYFLLFTSLVDVIIFVVLLLYILYKRYSITHYNR